MAEPESYSERYVAFMDVLGFSQLVRDADSDENKRGVIRSIIRTLRETFDEVPAATSFNFTQFSDCIVLSADRSEDGFVAVATGCVGLAGALMSEGVLLRGGIAIGNLLHTQTALFGTGLLRAYSHDNSGGPPRISLCEETHLDALAYDLSGLTRQDPMDLSPMLHTLWEYENYPVTAGGGESLVREGRSTANHISISAYDMNLPSPVRAKWGWMRLYWNRTLENQDVFPLIA